MTRNDLISCTLRSKTKKKRQKSSDTDVQRGFLRKERKNKIMVRKDKIYKKTERKEIRA